MTCEEKLAAIRALVCREPRLESADQSLNYAWDTLDKIMEVLDK